MTCRSCGATIAEGGRSCPVCGGLTAGTPGETRSCGAAAFGETRIYLEPKEEAGPPTRVFEPENLGKTVIFRPEAERKPIYGWLVVVEGPDAWEEFRIIAEDGQSFLGKGADCQFRLQDEKLDKVHASIRLHEGKLSVTDLDTSSGTLVNDQAITKVELQDGDSIRAGDDTMRFRKC